MRKLLCAVGAACLLLSACGGGEPGEDPAARPTPLRQAAQTLDASTLFDWAERTFPQFFPGHSANATLGPYLYRYYAGTGNYVGAAGDAVYVLGPLSGGALVQVGTLSGFRCVVLTCGGTVTGTVAMGAPVAGAAVTIKDAAGNTATATTSATGAFSASTAGLTAPLLLRVTTSGGATLYSVTADAQASTVANVTPFTDLLVRSWYGVQGVAPDNAFAAPAANPAPGPTQVNIIGQELLAAAQLAINSYGANITQPVDFISKPFNADHTGTDKMLDNTRVTTAAAGASMVLTLPSATSNVALAYDSANRSLAINSTTTSASATTASSRTAVVPVTGAQATAVDEINARLAAFAAVVVAKGANLAVADLEPFHAADLLDDGLNRTQYLADTVRELRQATSASGAVKQLRSIDTTATNAEVLVHFQLAAGAVTAQEDTVLRLRKDNGVWLVTGNGRIAQAMVQAEARNNQGATRQPSGPDINVDVRAPQGTVTSVDVSGLALTLQQGSTEVREASGVRLTVFAKSTDVLSPPLPAAGTPVTLTLHTGTGTVAYTEKLNAFTTEQIRITSPASSVASTAIGRTVAVTWTLPTTYAVAEVGLDASVRTGPSGDPNTLECFADSPALTASSTSGSITLPAACGGRPAVAANINVHTKGVNGERSLAILFME